MLAYNYHKHVNLFYSVYYHLGYYESYKHE